MNKDKVMRILYERFACSRFRIRDIPDEGLSEIAEALGLRTVGVTHHGMRVQLGRVLTAVVDEKYRCSSGSLRGATLARKGDPPEKDSSTEVYWVESE